MESRAVQPTVLQRQAMEVRRRKLPARGWSKATVINVPNRTVSIGMTRDVDGSLGERESVNVAITEAGRSEHWIYRIGECGYLRHGFRRRDTIIALSKRGSQVEAGSVFTLREGAP